MPNLKLYGVIKMAKKILTFLLLILPFTLGTIGYCMEDLSLTDAFYATFALHVINPVTDEKNILIELARWLCPLSLACGVVLFIRDLGIGLKNLLLSFRPGNVTIYSDSPFGAVLRDNIPRSVLTGGNSVYLNKNVIIMFSDENKSLEFYEKNKEKFNGKNVYIKLDNFDPLCIGNKDIRFFNLNDMIARDYWITRDLIKYYSANKAHIRIAVIGSSDLAERILNTALLYNLYSLDQCIEYHVWSENTLYENIHNDFCAMNNDKVIYHRQSLEAGLGTLKEMDRIIFADSSDHKLLTAVFELCTSSEIDCFSPDNGLINGVYDSGNITVFGSFRDILTYDNVITDKLYRLAMELNYRYACLYGGARGAGTGEMRQEWDSLNGFLKMSNIASADYHEIRLKIMNSDDSYEVTDTVAELEHIRWCRFHFLNHWKYGETKDTANRIHPCLLPFGELKEDDRGKDAEGIKLLLELKR